jgi:predicted RNA-binding Zn ribbon-like protein
MRVVKCFVTQLSIRLWGVEVDPLPVALMNTIWADRDGVHDTLDAGAADWLRTAAGTLLIDVLGGEAVLGTNLEETTTGLRRLRDALRRLAAELTEDHRPDAASTITDRGAALAVLNESCALATASRVLVWPDNDPPHAVARTTDPPSTLAVARLAAQAVDLFARPSALGACEAPGCVRYFVRDHPRRGWCSAACGNRARVARHYRRRHAAEG